MHWLATEFLSCRRCVKDKLLTQKEQSRGSNWLQHAKLISKCSYTILLYLLMYRDPGPHRTKDRRQGKLYEQLNKEVESSVKHTCFWVSPGWGGKCNRESRGRRTLKDLHCRSHRGRSEMDQEGIQRLVVLGLAKEADSNKYFCLCGKTIQSPEKEAPSLYFWGDADSDRCWLRPSMLEPRIMQDIPELVFILLIQGRSIDEQLGVLQDELYVRTENGGYKSWLAHLRVFRPGVHGQAADSIGKPGSGTICSYWKS